MKLLILFLFISFLSYSQDYPQNYFRSPLDIPLFLSGNFGEIRNNHFHAGLDMKTEGVEGKNIYAAAEGYISRIKISHGGYGKALYITHPNGYTTAYAHLLNFSAGIEKYVKDAQYQKESYEIELFPSKTQFKVLKGEIIALSGNSGGSGGPHLHFEIRETDTEIPVNPLLFGFNISDNIRPVIKTLGVYPINSEGTVNNSFESKLYKVSGDNGHYKLNPAQKITVSGKIGLGLEVLDFLDGSANRCGAYSIELFVDSHEVYCHEMEKIGFHETRYINSHVSYHDWKKSDSRIQRSYVQPNNQLNVYNCSKNQYVVDFKDDKAHQVIYQVRDAYGNLSLLEFEVQSAASELISNVPESDTAVKYSLFRFNTANLFETADCRVEIPPNVLYDNVAFEYRTSPILKNCLTPVHHVHHLYEPMHSYMALSVKIDSLKEKYSTKAIIVALNEKNEFLAAEGGTYKDGWITVKTRSFGPYTVMIDSVAPGITPFNVVPDRDMTSRGKLQMSIRDDLSGIDTYRGTVDGKWVLMEYDYKLERLTYFLDESRIEKGKKHHFELVVTDKTGNKSNYQIDFFW